MPLTNGTVAAIDRRKKDDPDFAAAVEAELQAMMFQTLIRDAGKLIDALRAAK